MGNGHQNHGESVRCFNNKMFLYSYKLLILNELSYEITIINSVILKFYSKFSLCGFIVTSTFITLLEY